MAGKWSIPGVPHKGWTCTSVEDLGAPDETCEVCETRDIRYVHHMQHPDYPESLAVGCICADHMENDYEGPRSRRCVQCVHPADWIVHPATGFQVASVHSICVSAIFSEPWLERVLTTSFVRHTTQYENNTGTQCRSRLHCIRLA